MLTSTVTWDQKIQSALQQIFSIFFVLKQLLFYDYEHSMKDKNSMGGQTFFSCSHQNIKFIYISFHMNFIFLGVIVFYFNDFLNCVAFIKIAYKKHSINSTNVAFFHKFIQQISIQVDLRKRSRQLENHLNFFTNYL